MKIAQVAPLYESVPPKLYGGTERVVSYLTEELVKQGHEVTLFASGDSVTKARLISHIGHSLRMTQTLDPLAHHIVQLQEVMERIEEFDVVHFHTDYLHFPNTNKIKIPHVTTLHGRLDLPELQFIYDKFKHQPLVSISNAQRRPLPNLNWLDTVYHGLPPDLYQKGEGKGGYAVFIGRISSEKRPDRAIEIAQKAGIKLKIAAKIDKVDQEYYQTYIEHLVQQPHVEFIGEIGDAEKSSFLGQAKALLFPIDWQEPFGMVLIEAMACGTPVIAFNHGSVPEIIDDKETGFIVENVEQAVEALEKIDLLDRDHIRKIFEQKFNVSSMALNYMEVFEKLIQNSQTPLQGEIISPSTPNN